MTDQQQTKDRPSSRNVTSLKALKPYIRRYKLQLGLIGLFLTHLVS